MRWLALTIALVGCAGVAPATPVVYGPYPNVPEQALFDRVVGRVSARGYRVLDPDPRAGHFAVRSRTSGRHGRVATFRFRFYRGGWVGVEVSGGGERNCGGEVLLPARMHREYGELVEGLMR